MGSIPTPRLRPVVLQTGTCSTANYQAIRRHRSTEQGVRHGRLGGVGSKRLTSQVQAGFSKRAPKLSNSPYRIHSSFFDLATLEAKQIAVRVECYRFTRTGN